MRATAPSASSSSAFRGEKRNRETDPSLRYVFCSSASSVSSWRDDMGEDGSVLSDRPARDPNGGDV